MRSPKADSTWCEQPQRNGALVIGIAPVAGRQLELSKAKKDAKMLLLFFLLHSAFSPLRLSRIEAAASMKPENATHNQEFLIPAEKIKKKLKRKQNDRSMISS